MQRVYVVTEYIEENGSYCCEDTTVFQEHQAAEAGNYYENADPRRAWLNEHEERTRRLGAQRQVYGVMVCEAIQDEGGEIVEYGDISQDKTYGYGDYRRECEESALAESLS